MQFAKPRVTVIVAARNAAATVDRSLASIARQTLRDWECIVCDDHSTDDTRQIALSWVRRDARFQIATAQGIGVVAARNHAIQLAKSYACAIFDADDLMHPRRLQLQLSGLQAQGGGTLASRVRYVPRAEMGEGMRRYEAWLNQQTRSRLVHERFIEMPMAHPSMMIETELLRRIGGYRERPWPEDYDLYLRLAGCGAPLGVLEKRLHAWRRDAGSASQTDPRYSIAAFAKCRAAALASDWLQASTLGANYHLMGYGNTGKRLATELAELAWHPSRILELSPARIGQRIRSAPVVHGPQWLTENPRRKCDDPQLIVSVAGHAARKEIRALLEATAWREGIDWVFAA